MKPGRLNRLAVILKEKTDSALAERVFKNHEEYFSSRNAKAKAAWMRQMVSRLEANCDAATCTEVLQSCGRKCCGINSRKHARKLYLESGTLDEFLEKMNQCGLGGGRLKLLSADTLSAGYDKCFCGQVSQTEVPFPTQTYCQCSVGWYKQLFETALETQVEVELLQSIISGAKSCEFRIRLTQSDLQKGKDSGSSINQ